MVYVHLSHFCHNACWVRLVGEVALPSTTVYWKCLQIQGWLQHHFTMLTNLMVSGWVFECHIWGCEWKSYWDMGGTDIGTDKHRYSQIDTDDADLGERKACNLLDFICRWRWKVKLTISILIVVIYIYACLSSCSLNQMCPHWVML